MAVPPAEPPGPTARSFGPLFGFLGLGFAAVARGLGGGDQILDPGRGDRLRLLLAEPVDPVGDVGDEGVDRGLDPAEEDLVRAVVVRQDDLGQTVEGGGGLLPDLRRPDRLLENRCRRRLGEPAASNSMPSATSCV